MGHTIPAGLATHVDADTGLVVIDRTGLCPVTLTGTFYAQYMPGETFGVMPSTAKELIDEGKAEAYFDAPAPEPVVEAPPAQPDPAPQQDPVVDQQPGDQVPPPDPGTTDEVQP